MNCGICYNCYDEGIHVPRSVPGCSHTYCDECLRKHTNDGKRNCPSCNGPIQLTTEGVSGFKKNFGVIDIIREQREKIEHANASMNERVEQQQQQQTQFKCSQKGCSENAMKWCEECQANYCERCCQTVHAVPFVADHKPRGIGESKVLKNPCRCGQREIEWFCSNRTCTLHDYKKCCLTCFNLKHKKCTKVPISDSHELLKDQIGKFIWLKIEAREKFENCKTAIAVQMKTKEELEMKKIEDYYFETRRQLELNYQKSKQQLRDYVRFCGADKNRKIDHEIDKISNDIHQIGKLEDSCPADLSDVSDRISQLLQSTSGKELPSSTFKNPKVVRRGIYYFPIYEMVIAGDWEEGKKCFTKTLKEMVGLKDEPGTFEITYGPVQLRVRFEVGREKPHRILYFSNISSPQSMNNNNSTGFEKVHITGREEDKYHILLDSRYEKQNRQTIHEVIRDNFF